MGNGPKANFLSALLGAAVVAVVFAVLALSGTFDDDEDGSAGVITTTSSEARDVPAPAETRTVTDVSELYRKVRDGVVYVQVNARAENPLDGGQEQQRGSGSG